MAVKGNPRISTQVYLEIDIIRDGVIVLKNGDFRGIIEVGGVNFFLRSQEEQDSLIMRFQDFLNAIEFPVQIVVQSRFLDLDFYISELRDRINKQSNPLMREQTEQYTLFVEQIVEQINVMEKRFFIVVPWYINKLTNNKNSIFEKIMGWIDPTRPIIRYESEFEKNKLQLMQRVDAVVSAISGLGVDVSILNTQQIIDLFYRSYNPDSSQKAKLKNVEGLDADVVLGKSSITNREEKKVFIDD
ncbi:MAG: hypothetical protein Fur0024_0180 [Patescibacteria group bacterium]